MTRLSANELLMLRAAGPQAAQLVAYDMALSTGRRLRAEAAETQAKALGSGIARLARLARRTVGPIAAGIVRARNRRRAIDQLNRLDDRLLHDIGLERGTLDEAVDATLEQRAPAWATDGLAGLGKAILAPLVRPVLRWRREAVTLGELGQLDDHILSDIGVTRGDLRYAPEAVLSRCESGEPANRNREPRHAA